MHAEYKRDVSHNYLIFHSEENINTASYQVRILTGNTMSSVLKCRMQGLDGKWLFYYDITSKQSLSSFYDQRKLKGEDIEMILQGFVCVLEELAEFLLNTEQLVLSPDYMFLDVEKKKISFCCLPDYHHPVQEQFRELTEYFLPRLDHEDPKAVNLGYGIYRKAMEPGMQLEHIKKMLYSTEGNPESVTDNSTENNQVEDTTEPKDPGRPQRIYLEEEAEKKEWTDLHVTDARKYESTDELAVEKKKTYWKLAAGCVAGVISLLGILTAGYLGYLPGIPVEIVIGAAIVLMGAGVGCTWAVEQKKKKESQSAQWRYKVQGADIQQDDSLAVSSEPAEVKPKKKEKEYEQEEYGETVVLSAGQLSGPASLVSREPGEFAPVYLEQEMTVIGKLEQASDVVIALPTVSRVHARIRKEGDEYYLADLNSRNGTSVNGRMLEAGEEYLLQDEDQVDFAQARYVFLK